MSKPAKHTVSSYDSELKHIRKTIRKMGEQVETILEQGRHSLQGESTLTHEEVIALDNQVNAMEGEVDEKALAVLALRQPLAVDLRFVVSSLRVATIVERMGDLAKGCHRVLTHMEGPALENVKTLMDQMFLLVEKMLRQSLSGYGKFDSDKADRVWPKEDKVDDAARQAFDLLAEHVNSSPKDAEFVLRLMLVIKNLERLGDYTTRITQMVHFITAGADFPDESDAVA